MKILCKFPFYIKNGGENIRNRTEIVFEVKFWHKLVQVVVQWIFKKSTIKTVLLSICLIFIIIRFVESLDNFIFFVRGFPPRKIF